MSEPGPDGVALLFSDGRLDAKVVGGVDECIDGPERLVLRRGDGRVSVYRHSALWGYRAGRDVEALIEGGGMRPLVERLTGVVERLVEDVEGLAEEVRGREAEALAGALAEEAAHRGGVVCPECGYDGATDDAHPVGGKRGYCEDCGHRWDPEEYGPVVWCSDGPRLVLADGRVVRPRLERYRRGGEGAWSPLSANAVNPRGGWASYGESSDERLARLSFEEDEDAGDTIDAVRYAVGAWGAGDA